MENYKNKYEKALKVASQWHKDGIGDVKTIVECIFPELKESKDEKIRKEIVAYLESQGASIKYDFTKWIAWLEKGGQKDAWSEEDEEILKTVILHVKKYQQIVNPANETGESDLTDWLKSLKPRWKPTKLQLEALEAAYKQLPNIKYPLESLYNDLKSL